MKRFTAYFDYLGFKDFIERNDSATQSHIMGNNFRDIEMALGQGRTKKSLRGVVSDIDKSNINCMNFSDTVVFWTNDDTDESLNELLKVAYKFNRQSIEHTFPLRGAIVYGDIIHVDYRQSNSGGGSYNINSLYGKALVSAHMKAESQNWAGTVIDESLIHELTRRGHNPLKFLEDYATPYKVPYKNSVAAQPNEFALRLTKSEINNETFTNVSKYIRDNFGYYNKRTEDSRVQEKISNTLTYLETFKERTDPDKL